MSVTPAMLLLIGVALAQTRAASRGFATATGANDGILLRLPACEDASVSNDNSCCHNRLDTGICQSHSTPTRYASFSAEHAQMPSTRPFTTVDVDHSTSDRLFTVTGQFSHAVCTGVLFCTCSTSRKAPIPPSALTEPFFEDHFRPLPVHGFALAQTVPSWRSHGAPDKLGQCSVLLSSLSRDEIRDHDDGTHQPLHETHFDDRSHQLPVHGFARARTVLSWTPQPAPDKLGLFPIFSLRISLLS